MAELRAEVRSCRKCRAALSRRARYCARCGEPTRRQRRKLRDEWQRLRSAQTRPAWAVAWVFVGTLLVLVGSSALESGAELSVAVGLVGVGLIGCLLLGAGELRRSLGGPASLAQLGQGVLFGLISFAVAWCYVEAIAAIGSWGMEDLDLGDLEFEAPPWWAVVLAAPILEEWLDRGVAWRAVQRVARRPRTVLLTTSALFAVSHGLNGSFWFEIPHRFVAGVLFGVLRHRTGSLLPSIAAHMSLNGTAVLLEG